MSRILQGCKKRVGQNKVFNVNKSQNSHVLYTKTRVICNPDVHNGCSSNWRADWLKFLGRTYAEVVVSNPSLSVYTDINNVKQVAKSSVTVSCKSKQINRPTCMRECTPVTGKYKTQRSGTVTNSQLVVTDIAVHTLYPCDK